MTGDVQLTPLDDQTLGPLLALAVAESDPEEVMPPVTAPAGWSDARQTAFRTFYQSNFGGLHGPTRTQMYAILCDSDVVGMIRMARCDERATIETGMWLGRSARGRGIGGAALELLLAEAARGGSRRVVAQTTSQNTAALSVLRRCGAELRDHGTGIRAEISLWPRAMP